MLAFICFFFPAVISVCIFDNLSKNALKVKNLIYRFCTNIVLINLLCLLIKKFILFTIGAPLCQSGDMMPSVALNYMILSLPIAIVLPLVEIFLSKKVKFTVKEDENEEKKEI